jgi:filamentous hemagglutinin family protein
VYFANPSGVLNILTRVTGKNSSSIFGTLGVDGSANLFLMNPNGILFGKNASLDIQESFIGTTANGLKFGNQGVFSATNPEAPALLTINPNALSFSQQQSGAITNQSQAPAGVNPDGNITTGLRVPDGKSLLLVGGNINSDGGRFRAYDGRVELTGLAAPGDIGLNVAGDNLSLNIPNDASFADVFLGNISAISVFGDKGGEIAINARNIGIDNSFLFAGISASKGTPTTQARDINLNATGSISISQNSSIYNSVYGNGGAKGGNVSIQANDNVSITNLSNIFANIESGGVGNSGDIKINAGSFTLTDGSQLQSGLRQADSEQSLPAARGNGGNININVRNTVNFARPKDGLFAGISTGLDPGSEGNAGNVFIKAGDSVSLNNARIDSFVDKGAVGNGGNINIQSGSLSLNNGASLSTGTLGQGNAGNLTINAGSLEIKDGSEIQGSTRGKGNAGNITINTRDNVILDGRDGEKGVSSRVIVAVQPGAEGSAGNINVTTSNLKVTNGAFFSSSTNGQGDAGNITVDVRDATNLENDGKIFSNVFQTGVGKGGDIRLNTGTLSLTGGSQLSSNVSGKGNAGNITINARDTIKLDDVTGDKLTGIQSGLITGGVGKGGNIDITTGSLFATNGAQLSAGSDGRGDASNITINARDVVSFDTSVGNEFSSRVENAVGFNAVGNGGDIRITAREIFFKNGSRISAASFGQGNAGNIIIDATDKVSFDGVGSSYKLSSGATTIATQEGRGGDISVKTGTLSLINGAQIDASTSGKGNGGNITIDARDRINFESIGSNQNFSGAFSVVQSNGVGNAGNIKLTTNSLSLSNSGRVSTGTLGRGNAGDITINASDITANDAAGTGFPSGVSSSVAATGVGRGGNISINTGSLSISDRASFNASTLGKGDAGNILINATGDVTMKDNSQIVAATFGEGNAGNITVNTSGKLSLKGFTLNGFNFDTGIFTIVGQDSKLAGKGKGGNINLTSRDLSLNGAAISASSIVEGSGGNLDIKADSIRLDNKSAIASVTNSGDGGNINLTATDYLLLRRNSNILTTAGLQKFGGDGGNITINTPFIVAVPKENSDISANAFTGKGGNINIQTQNIFGIEARPKPTNQSDITASSELGVQGQVSIRKPDVDPSRGLLQSPQNFKDKSDELDQLCGRGRKPLGRFVVTGRGIIQPNPMDLMQGDIDFAQIATLIESNSTDNVNQISDRLTAKIPPVNRIVEAQAIVRGADGTIYLVAEAPNATPYSRPAVSACADVGKR